MRQQHSLNTISGFHEGTTSGATLKSSWDFVTTGVQSLCSVRNATRDLDGFVLSVSDRNTLITDINFEPGDFFEITLPTEWLMSSNILPTYELICNLCGFETKREILEAHRGLCKVCYDVERAPIGAYEVPPVVPPVEPPAGPIAREETFPTLRVAPGFVLRVDSSHLLRIDT